MDKTSVNGKLILTNSAVKAFKTCSMKYNWRYVRGIVSVENSEALRVGSAVHEYLEGFYKRVPYNSTGTSGLSAKGKGYIEGIIDNYSYQYGDDFELFEVIDAEKNLSGLIKNPATGRSSRACEFGGKLDLLVRTKVRLEGLPIGSLVLIENKTASKVDENLWEQLEMDYQTRLYSNYIQQEMKESVAGVIFNVIEKPAIRQKKTETEEAFEDRVRLAMADEARYYRKFVKLTDHKLNDALKDLWKSQQQISRVRLLGNYTKNPSACHNYFRQCDYYHLCNSEQFEKVIAYSGLFKYRQANCELMDIVKVQFPVEQEIAIAVSF